MKGGVSESITFKSNSPIVMKRGGFAFITFESNGPIVMKVVASASVTECDSSTFKKVYFSILQPPSLPV